MSKLLEAILIILIIAPFILPFAMKEKEEETKCK